MKKNLYYYDPNMTLTKLCNIQQEANLNCQTKYGRKKFIAYYKDENNFFYGSKKQLKEFCKEYDFNIDDFYKIC